MHYVTDFTTITIVVNVYLDGKDLSKLCSELTDKLIMQFE